MSASGKRFTIEKQSDPVDFLTWLLNTLHVGLTNGKRSRPSVVTQCFQGELEVTTEAGSGAPAAPMHACGIATMRGQQAGQLHIGPHPACPNGHRR